jgi:hypothetical protein
MFIEESSRTKGFGTKCDTRFCYFYYLILQITLEDLYESNMSSVIYNKCPADLTRIINLYNGTIWVHFCLRTLCVGGGITRASHRSVPLIKPVLPNNCEKATSLGKIKATRYLCVANIDSTSFKVF